MILFPLAIVSDALVPTQHMPTVVRTIADWNPVSAVTAAAATCSAIRTRRPSVHAWPLQHAVLASLIWSLALLAVFAPCGHLAVPHADCELTKLAATHE